MMIDQWPMDYFQSNPYGKNPLGFHWISGWDKVCDRLSFVRYLANGRLCPVIFFMKCLTISNPIESHSKPLFSWGFRTMFFGRDLSRSVSPVEDLWRPHCWVGLWLKDRLRADVLIPSDHEYDAWKIGVYRQENGIEMIEQWNPSSEKWTLSHHIWGFLSWMVHPLTRSCRCPGSSQARSGEGRRRPAEEVTLGWKVCGSFQASHLPSWNQAWHTIPYKWRFLAGTIIELNGGF